MKLTAFRSATASFLGVLAIVAAGRFACAADAPAADAIATVASKVDTPPAKIEAAPPVQSYSNQEWVYLNPGEEYVFTGHDGQTTVVRLVSAEDHFDSVIHRARMADVVVTIDGREWKLRAGPYVMPSEAGKIRIQADLTSGFEPWVPKRVQFSIWDAKDPIVDPARFQFPLDNFELFSGGWQAYDEVCWMGTDSDGVGGTKHYHNYGIDLLGYESRDAVHSPIAGKVLGVWTEAEKAKGYDAGSIVILGDHGLWWEAAHLDAPAPGLKAGSRVEIGQWIGDVGRRGPYCRNPNMHWGTYFVTGPVRWNQNRKLNLYPWFIAAYQEKYKKNLYAVPGGHQVLFSNEKATFDASDSLCFDSQITGYRWVFSDGETLEGKTVERAFAEPGVHGAVLWVEDAKGRRDAACVEVRVFPRENAKCLPKVAMTASPTRGAGAGEPVYFRGWMQGPAKGPIRLDFGDGSPAVDCEPYAEVAHAYAQPGLYIATARIAHEGMPIVRQFKLVVLDDQARAARTPSASRPPAPCPNFVIILADDLGYGDLSCYGQTAYKTPNLDRMAAEGARLTEFRTPAPFCAPTRAALMTGRYPLRCGLPNNPNPNFDDQNDRHLPESEVLLPEVLHQEGYVTGMIGKWHLGHAERQWLPTHRGFEEYFGIPYSNDMRPVRLLDGDEPVEYPVVQATLTQRYTQRALDFIARNKARPFFLYLAHAMPHKPLAVSDAFAGKSGAGLYGDVVTELDWSVGQVLQRIKQLGLDDHTLVIFTSDNGPWFGGSTGGLRGMKGTGYEGGCRVPFLARWPGVIPAGHVSDAPTITMDIFTTVLEAAQVRAPRKPIDGRDLMPMLTSGVGSLTKYYFGQQGPDLATVRSGKWKLHVRAPKSPWEKWTLDSKPWKDQVAPDGTTILAPAQQYGPEAYPGVKTGDAAKPLQLFDVQSDPAEQHDVAAEHAEVVKELQRAYDGFLKGLEPPKAPPAKAAAKKG